ncbi:hypothetical protein CYMTET_28951 [Cymbomonas tetramitiformis]|uniref:Tyr recombinase domain-containing protein n=1 Tax=Cymbomonas tetramitiformis TaxID=36881 RepID=A0AAE0FNF1_9CHLO|nr:hypothetical protein CYMTET_28951 [Cymbomonas tetramitiformis]
MNSEASKSVTFQNWIQLFLILRTKALILMDLYALKRPTELGATRVEGIIRFPDNSGFLFNYQWGKTLRAGDAHVFGIRRLQDKSKCPISALEDYLKVMKLLKLTLSEGFLFRPVRSGIVENRPLTRKQMTSDLKFWLEKAGLFQGETFFSIRTAGAIQLFLEGSDLKSVMGQAYWKTERIARHYMKIWQVPVHYLRRFVARHEQEAFKDTELAWQKYNVTLRVEEVEKNSSSSLVLGQTAAAEAQARSAVRIAPEGTDSSANVGAPEDGSHTAVQDLSERVNTRIDDAALASRHLPAGQQLPVLTADPNPITIPQPVSAGEVSADRQLPTLTTDPTPAIIPQPMPAGEVLADRQLPADPNPVTTPQPESADELPADQQFPDPAADPTLANAIGGQSHNPITVRLREHATYLPRTTPVVTPTSAEVPATEQDLAHVKFLAAAKEPSPVGSDPSTLRPSSAATEDGSHTAVQDLPESVSTRVDEAALARWADQLPADHQFTADPSPVANPQSVSAGKAQADRQLPALTSDPTPATIPQPMPAVEVLADRQLPANPNP